MASDQGPIATEAPPALQAALPAVASDAIALESTRTKSLKRVRELTPTSPTSASSTHLNPVGSPAKSARLAFSGQTPPPLTASAALEDQRRRKEEDSRLNPPGASDNPAHRVLAALSGGALAMSRPTDAPTAPMAPSAALEPSTTKNPTAVPVPVPIPIPSNNNATADSRGEPSPRSVASAAASMAGAAVTESPTPMDVDARVDQAQVGATEGDKTVPSSLSYPGSLHAGATTPVPPARGMSYPLLQGQSPPLPSGKKHKCPFCPTEFTRHHNLKSHMLTHSQEKPYICQECQMRFRRLHDLKRHSKLHTGEKPHVCPKCDRKFARGDALARHAKGPGGCAGRRSSMGSFADGEDGEDPSMMEGDDSTMAGVVYGNEDDMPEEERRRLSLPSIKAQHVAGSQPGVESFSPHSRTYPPAGPRPGPTGGLYPPNVERAAAAANRAPSMTNSVVSGHTPTTSTSSMPHSATTSSSLYSQSSISESPKPLSPAGVQTNQVGDKPSGILQHQFPGLPLLFPPQQFGRRQSERHSPTTMPLPSLPGLSGFAAPDPRFPSGQGAAGAHSRSSSGAMGSKGDGSGSLASADAGLWTLFQALEEKVKLLSEKVVAMEKSESSKQAQIGYLTTEVTALKKQLDARNADAATAKA